MIHCVLRGFGVVPVSWGVRQSPKLLAALVVPCYCIARDGNLDHHEANLECVCNSVQIHVRSVDDAILGQRTGLVGEIQCT